MSLPYKMICKQTGVEFESATYEHAATAARVSLRNALKNGIKNPKATIYRDDEPYVVLHPIDVAEPIRDAQTLTDGELETLKRVLADYEADGVENTEWNNTLNDAEGRRTRGYLGGLMRKQVLRRTDCPNCFNPIYPSNSFVATCEKYGLAISDKVKAYL